MNKNQIKTGLMIALLLFGFASKAQTRMAPLTDAFTVQQAVEYAYAHSATVKNAQLEEAITADKVKEFRGASLPQVKVNGDMKYFMVVPTSVVPNFFNPAGPLMALKFGTTYNTSAGASASWLLADASYFLALQAQKELGSLMQYSTTRSKTDVAEQVSKAYFTVLISEKKMELLNANILRINKILSETRAANQQGLVEKLDVDRIQIAYVNLVTEQTKVVELLDLARGALKFQMGYNVNGKITLSDTLSDSQLNSLNLLNETFDPSKRVEIKLLDKQIQLTEMQLKARSLAWIPNIAAYSSLSAARPSNTFDAFDHVKYYPTALVGVTVNATLFDGMQNHYKMDQIRLQIQQAKNTREQAENGLQLEALNARTTLSNALLSVQSQKSNLVMAEDVARVTKIKFQQGVGSSLEVMTAETSLKEAQTNYLSALYDAYMAGITYKKAMGSLIP